MSDVKYCCGGLGLFLCVLVVIVVVRTFTFSVRTDQVVECKNSDSDFIKLNDQILERFKKGLRIQTVSRDVGDISEQALVDIQNLIKKEYPVVHSSPLVTLDVVGNYSLLYSIQGTNTSLIPYLLASHLDVVPAQQENWDYPPFGAETHNGFIYARGTIDVKLGVFGILESMEYLLSNGFKPKRTIYIGFGHDEEIGGSVGALNIANKLEEKGISQLEYIIDEGLNVLDGLVPGLSKPSALIGTSEKGQAILRLKVKGKPGHSSMPPKESALSILVQAVHRLETTPHPSMFGYGPEKDMFEHIASELSLPYRMLMSNLWLFSPLVSRFLAMSPTTNAIVRTITAVTMFQSGVKDNVIPGDAVAIVNHRIHPAQSIQQVIDYDRYIINDDRVIIEIKNSMEPLPISPCDDNNLGYQMIKNSIRQVWTNSVVAPGVMIGNTDTKHYIHLSNNIYRFTPSYLYPQDIPRFHGNNERISLQNYQQAINFYYHLIKNTDAGLSPSHKHSDEL
ncbi:hypothetical protein SNE40_015042 [Patella caerulea]|uniref:Peptidase M20 dimerisation domain-containing protein n=1 Tax=Patella caerulea TaxID=87958 RepID=A0AAN8JJ97_PATCE